MELYLIRHGDMNGDPHAHYEAATPLAGCLSDAGCRQAAALGDALRDVAFDAAFTSPLGRAVQTAQALTCAAGAAITVLPWLIEWRPATATGECDETEFEAIMEAASRVRPEQCWKTPAGEGTLEMSHRVITGFLRTMNELGVRAGHGGYLLDDAEDARRLAFVAHGGSLGVFAAFLLGIPIRPCAPIGFEKTGVAVFDLVRRVDVWYPMLRIPTPYGTEALADATPGVVR